VTNDGHQNQLWINQHNGTFKNTALLAGAALSEQGTAKASMGVDAGDFDNDGDDDIVMTELTGQGSNLFVNDGSGIFTEQSARVGIHAPTLPYTGFGTAWLDFDNDGWLDILAVNGLVFQNPERVKNRPDEQRTCAPYITGHFEDVTGLAGPVFARG
jgi:hypothetical protein